MNLNNMILAMKELKFDENEPIIYDLIAELESENQTGLIYDEFVDNLTAKLQDRENEKSVERIFDLFIEETKGTVTYEILKKVH